MISRNLPPFGLGAPGSPPLLLVVLWAGLMVGCDGPDRGAEPLPGGVVETPPPTPPGSAEPNLALGPEGEVYLSWFERTGEEAHALRFVVLEVDQGGAVVRAGPRTIVERPDFFVNWADFPSLRPLPGGHLVAHWPQRSGPGTYHYDVVTAWSSDGGVTWRDPVRPHQDGTLSEHGFVSMIPWGEAEVGAVWLDGRKYETQPDNPEMTLRFATLTPEGPGDEVLLDDRVCECCQTSAVRTASGALVVYRNRSPEEIRDIYAVRYEDGRWSEPRPVYRDGWEIPACPVNGPMAAALEDEVAVAWFTAAGDEPRVRLAFSRDGGATFQEPIQVDDGNPAGRVATLLLPGGDAMVSWLERTGDGAEVRVRRVGADGSRSPSQVVAVSSEARASGFPRMVMTGSHLVFAWTDTGEESRVRVATARLPGEPE